jgi:hypothetical protein
VETTRRGLSGIEAFCWNEAISQMPFSIDFLDDGRVLEWEATADGAVATER